MISIIVAHDLNGGIGKDNSIPWYIPNDFKWFKEKTLNKTVVMGTNTYFSLPDNVRPLPQRESIVICNQCEHYERITDEGAMILTSLDEVIKYSKNNDIFIIGGASIYKQFFYLADRLYITKINKEFECDTFFEHDNYIEWEKVYESEEMTQDDFTYTFNIYE